MTLPMLQIEMWFQMFLPCLQGSPSQCNIEFQAISSKCMRNSIWRHIQFLVDIDEITLRSMLHCDGAPRKHGSSTWNHIYIYYRSKVITTSGLAAAILNCWYVVPSCWGMLKVVLCYISIWFGKSTRFLQNFNHVSVIPAAILDFQCNI